MSVYIRPDSKYYWMTLERRGVRPIQKSTRVPHEAPTPAQRKTNRILAEEIYHSAMGDLAREQFHLPTHQPTKPFTDWVDWYTLNVTATHRGAEREREILGVLRKAFEALPLGDVDRTAVTEWMTARAAKVSARTVNREIDVLKSILRAAAEHREIEASPIAGMRRLQVRRPQRRLLKPAEEDRLLKLLAPDIRTIVIMGLDTLCRLGDILDLRRDQDHGRELWIGDPKDPRQAEPYTVPVSKRLRVALDGLPRERGQVYYFPARRLAKTERDRRNAIAHAIRRACKRARPKIPYGRNAGGITFHWATRRTGATRMIQGGIDPATVQRIGHWRRADVVLEIYGEGSTAAARRAVEIPGRVGAKKSARRKRAGDTPGEGSTKKP